MKIIFAYNNFCFIFFNAFYFIGPFTAKLYCGFNSFNTGIHWQYFIITKIFCNKFCIFAKSIIIKCPAGKRKLL